MQHRIEVAIDGIEVSLRLDGALLAIDLEGGSLGRDRTLYFRFLPDGAIEIEVFEDQNGDLEPVKLLSMTSGEVADFLIQQPLPTHVE